jgi:lysophospholipase L1-like esterase
VVAVLLVLAGAELGMRAGGRFLSGDVAHLESVPEIVDRVVSGSGEGVLFLGNSLVGEGIDDRLLETRLREAGAAPGAVARVNPDGTTVMEWHYLLRSRLGGRASNIGALVLGFGPAHLADRAPTESLQRMALYHVGPDDLGPFVREELASVEDRAAFHAARWVRILAMGERVQPRVLDRLIPGYRDQVTFLLGPRNGAGGPPEAGARGPGNPSHRYLAALVDDAARAGLPLLLLPMPEAGTWTLLPGEREIIERCRVTVLDLRDVVNLPPERFPDGVHLDAQGRTEWTEALAPHLLAFLARPRPERTPRPCPPPARD